MFLIVWSHLALITFPALSALFYKIFKVGTIEIRNPLFFVFALGCVAVVWSFILIFNAHRYRTKINNEIKNIPRSD